MAQRLQQHRLSQNQMALVLSTGRARTRTGKYSRERRTIAHPPDKKRRLEKRERKRRQSLDGDGSWRLASGERRLQERRADEQDQAPTAENPSLDSKWEAFSSSIDSPESQPSAQSQTNATEQDSHSIDAANESLSRTNKHTDINSAHNRPVDESAVKPKSVGDSDTRAESRRPLQPEEQTRLNSLKTMLDASNARFQQATRNRSPVFAAGLEVKVTKGDHAGKIGVVLDADYIENRALVSLPDQESPRWIGFKSLGHPD